MRKNLLQLLGKRENIFENQNIPTIALLPFSVKEHELEERWAWILHQFWYFLDLWSWERYLTYWISFSSFVNWVYSLPYSFIKGWNYIRWVTHLGHSQRKELINTALWWEWILPESLFPPITKIYPKYHLSFPLLILGVATVRKINI